MGGLEYLAKSILKFVLTLAEDTVVSQVFARSTCFRNSCSIRLDTIRGPFSIPEFLSLLIAWMVIPCKSRSRFAYRPRHWAVVASASSAQTISLSFLIKPSVLKDQYC
jgi:hypothetical protein